MESFYLFWTMGDNNNFNISAKDITAEDSLVRDRYVNTTKDLCSYKMRTSVAKVPAWIDVLTSFYSSNPDFEIRANTQNDKSVLRIKREGGKKSALTITVFGTGSITIQGDKSELEGFVQRFDTIKKLLDEKLGISDHAIPARPLPTVSIPPPDTETIESTQPGTSSAVEETDQANILSPERSSGPTVGQDCIDTPLGHFEIATPALPSTSKKAPPAQRLENTAQHTAQEVTPVKKGAFHKDVKKGDRIRQMEAEILSMDKRMTSHFDQLRELVIDAIDEKVNELKQSVIRESNPVSILSDESNARVEALESELKAAKEKNRKLEEESRRAAERDRTNEAKIVSLSDLVKVANEEKSALNTTIQGLHNQIRLLEERKRSSENFHPAPSDYTQPRAQQNEERSDRWQAVRRTERPNQSQSNARSAEQRNTQRSDQSQTVRQPERRQLSHSRSIPLKHLVQSDSHTRYIVPRRVGENTRINTHRGATIRDGTAYFKSNRAIFEPTESVTLHFGSNTILQNRNMNRSDLIEKVMLDYEELVKAARRRYPNITINVSEVFTLGKMRNMSESERLQLNEIITDINFELRSLTRLDRNLRITRHSEINDNTNLRFDGLHLNDAGLEIFTKDLARSLYY